MPAHNEEGYLETSVGSVVAGLRERADGFEVLVVENGSKDATRDEANRVAGANPEVRVLELDVADYGAALRSGFLGSRADVVVVIGSKRGPGSEDQRALGRKVVTSVFSAVLRHGFGLKASDTHGLKA